MSRIQKTLFILGEASWLTWIIPFFRNIKKYVFIATYDFQKINGVHVFPFTASANEVARWIIENGFVNVVILSNQSGLTRDLEITKLLRKKDINILSQSEQATSIGINKIIMKQFFIKNHYLTPQFIIASSVTDAINQAQKIGYPLLLKVPMLSEGRKMALVNAPEDISNYYYENAITGKIILEKFILGKEVSTIVYSNFGNAIVFPVVSKPSTNYLFKAKNTRERIYIAPDKSIKEIEKKIQLLALDVAEKIGNQLLVGFDMVVDAENNIYILELNARMTETLRMSMILTGTNLMEMLFFRKIKGSILTPKGFVADIPYTLISEETRKNPMVKSASNTRVTLFAKNRESQENVMHSMHI